MNETLKIILNRRSVRKYKEEQIKDEELDTILEAGKFAPSAMNQQSWHFTVVQNKEMLEKLNKAFKDVFLKSGDPRFEAMAKAANFSPFYNAPTYIIVSGDEKAIAPHNDGTLALENMFLAAHSLGIGSCWINAIKHLFSAEESDALKKELGIPEGYVAVASGSFGYPAVEPSKAAARKEGTVNIIK